MPRIPKNLEEAIKKREKNGNLRQLSSQYYEVDFYSNDYLGYSSNKNIQDISQSILKESKINKIGSTGSRLISGNHPLFGKVEQYAKTIFNSDAALFYASGYDANLGLLSAVLKPKDLVFYDELCHASIRDGLLLTISNSFKYKHNDLEDLKVKIERQKQRLHPQNIYIITESVFSMDGDQCDLLNVIKVSNKFGAHIILDEAHAVGVVGKDYKGLSYDVKDNIFARIYTCGKALGTHGAFILGSELLKQYLINFSRPIIYSTAVSPHQLSQVFAALQYFENNTKEKVHLQNRIEYFKNQSDKHKTNFFISKNDSAIQYISINGNEKAKAVAEILQNQGFGVKAILSPTVPQGQERIRICLHSFNSVSQIKNLLSLL